MLPSTVSTMHTRLRRGIALAVVPVALVVAGCSSAPATTAPAAADAYTVAEHRARRPARPPQGPGRGRPPPARTP